MIKVEITGFTNIDQAKTFADWYCGSGEQEIGLWLKGSPECKCTGLLTRCIDVVDEIGLVNMKVEPVE